MSRAYVDEHTEELTENFPNTYTFTKSMAERVLKKRAGDMPIVLIRPTIVAASWKEPMAGWIDTIAAAGGLTLAGTIGILNFVYTKYENIADMVPVDICCNATIVATAWAAYKRGFQLVHVGTSH